MLFKIDPRPFEAAMRQAEANALRDAAASDQARSQERRYQDLLDKNFVSKEAYAQIRTNAETAEAIAKASQAALDNARLNLEYCTIRSPIEGYVGKIQIQSGNLVKANDANPLVVINQVQPIYVNFAVPEQRLPEVRELHGPGSARPCEASTPGSDRAAAPTGALIFVDNAVDPSTGTIKLRAQFDNKDECPWPGQFVTVSVRLLRAEGRDRHSLDRGADRPRGPVRVRGRQGHDRRGAQGRRCSAPRATTRSSRRGSRRASKS